MKGRSLEELDEMFLNRVSVRNFRKYECHLREDVENDVLRGKFGDDEKKVMAVSHAEEVETRQDEAKKE
jgi:hypothetical protein